MRASPGWSNPLASRNVPLAQVTASTISFSIIGRQKWLSGEETDSWNVIQLSLPSFISTDS